MRDTGRYHISFYYNNLPDNATQVLAYLFYILPEVRRVARPPASFWLVFKAALSRNGVRCRRPNLALPICLYSPEIGCPPHKIRWPSHTSELLTRPNLDALLALHSHFIRPRLTALRTPYIHDLTLQLGHGCLCISDLPQLTEFRG